MKRKRMPDSEKAALSELKSRCPFTGFKLPIKGDDFCKVAFIGRGEEAFYQEAERALFVQVIVRTGLIDSKSIKQWDTDDLVTVAERVAVVERVAIALKLLGVSDVTIV